MSRVGKTPVALPSGVEAKQVDQALLIKGALGELRLPVSPLVKVEQKDGQLLVTPSDDGAAANAMSGTVRALAANMVQGVSKGFERKLQLVGVGFRAQAQGAKLNLQIGFSHPVVKDMPAGIKVECPTQTEIIVKGADRQVVGQVAAEIRAFRPPEPYKGKGIRYSDEKVTIKETKKK